MKLRKITALVLALILALTASSVTAFAEGGTDLTEGFDILFDGEFWRAYPIDSKEDEIYLSDLNITLTDTEGRIVPQDACDLIGGTLVWDDEKQEDIFTPMDEPYSLTVNEDYMQSGFGGFGVYAVAKDGSGYTGETEPREFMLWHKYSFNWFGANADFGEEYMGQCTWSWHDYYAIPADRIEEPVIHGIAYEDVDPQYYEITYFERGERPDFDDPEYDQKLYPETDPLDGLPTEPGSYFARIDGKEPYYGVSYIDFDVIEPVPETDFARDVELRFDGNKEWEQDYYIQNRDDKLTLDQLNISVVTRSGETLDKNLYDLHIGVEDGWDEENDEAIYREVEAPYGLDAKEDGLRNGWCMFCVVAVAKEDSGYEGMTRVYEFMIRHTKSLERDSSYIDFGEDYRRNSFRSWHTYFYIPVEDVSAPVVYDSLGNKLDESNYTLTYYKRTDNEDWDVMYNENEPLDGMPAVPGQYFVRVDGIGEYYGTSYVDFDIFEEKESFAMVRGSDRRYYDGDTIYLNKGEEAFICFDTEPYSGLIPGWRNDLLEYFTIDEQPDFNDEDEDDNYAYAHVTAKDLQADTVGTLYYGWYLYDDVFDRFGGMHWDTAVPVMTCSVRIAVVPDEVDYYLGDADGDGDVTIMDVTLLQRSLAGLKLDDDSTLMQADVDGNGRLESVDVTFIQRRLAKMKVPFDVGKPMVKDR